MVHRSRTWCPRFTVGQAPGWYTGRVHILQSMYGSGTGRGDREPRNKGAAGHACLQCGVGGNDAVVAPAQGHRKLLQGTVEERRLVNGSMELARLASSFRSRLAGLPRP